MPDDHSSTKRDRSTGAAHGVIVTVDDAGEAGDFTSSGIIEEEHRRLSEWPGGPKLFAHFRDLPGRRGCRTCPPTCAPSGSPRAFRPRSSSAPRCATAARDGGRPQRRFDLHRVRSAALSVPTPGRLLTNARLLDRVWGEDRRRRHGARLQTIIKKLRRKLGDDPANPTWICNERGTGYRLAQG